MTTSGTYAFAPTLDELVTEAWERCGKAESIITGAVARSARRSIQLMLLDWASRGLNLWSVQSAPFTLAIGVPTVRLGASTVDVLDAYLTVGGVDRILSAVSRTDYVNIPLKLTTGPPTQYWVERSTPAPVLHLYPAPDQAYALTLYQIMQPQDVTSIMQTADAPVLWSEALTAGLAARLAVKFAPDRVQLLAPLAAAAYENAVSEERERVPLTVMPSDWSGW